MTDFNFAEMLAGLQAEAALNGEAPAAEPEAPEELYWAVQLQTIHVDHLDQYLASVSDQEEALRESSSFAGRLVLRSQRRPDGFWVVDAWTDRYSLDTAAITLRTLSSVAGLAEEPRATQTVQVPIGNTALVFPGAEPREADQPLPFFLIAENHVKPVAVERYLGMQDRFTRELEEEDGYGRRLLLRNVTDSAHFFVIDEWRSERHAYEAFERRQNAVSEIVMTEFLSHLAERGEMDFALGIHA